MRNNVPVTIKKHHFKTYKGAFVGNTAPLHHLLFLNDCLFSSFFFLYLQVPMLSIG